MKTSNTIIKVLALLAVATIIGYVIFKQKQDEIKFEAISIKEFDFHKYIGQRIEDELPENANWQTAMDTYKTLYGVIQTENAIMLENGQPILEPTTADSCYAEAFTKYWHLFQRYVDHDYFGVKRDNWSKDGLFQIKNAADSLRCMNGRSEQQSDSLKEYANYVEKYYDIEVKKNRRGELVYEDKNGELEDKVKNCNSLSSFKSVKSLKDAYNVYPYTNNKAFAATMNSAEADAKKNWESTIERRVNTLVSKPLDFWAKDKIVNDTLTEKDWSGALAKFNENGYDNNGKFFYGYNELTRQVNELETSSLKQKLGKDLRERYDSINTKVTEQRNRQNSSNNTY
jgi:hypothetical protein